MVQSFLVDWIGCNRDFNYRACIRPEWSARAASIPFIEFSYRRAVGYRSDRNFSGDASFDSGRRELINRVCCGVESDHFASSELLVADRFRAGGALFRLHLATLCRKGKRSSATLKALLGVLNNNIVKVTS